MAYKAAYDSVHFFMSDMTSRVVAKTGIPTDRYHIGKLLLHNFQNDPEFISQIDGATGESETNASVLNRSVRCAIAFRKLGLQTGDVLVLMGPNHIDLGIPQYASLYLGVSIAGIDSALGVNELVDNFNITKPKIIFCQSEISAVIEKALNKTGIEAKIVTFNKGSDHITLAELLKDTDDDDVTNFLSADFDPAETAALLTSTSGTTGTPKAAILTHKNLYMSTAYGWRCFTKFPSPTRMVLLISPIQWLSAGITYLGNPIMKITRLQTSQLVTPEHFAHLVNTYKPTFVAASPVLMESMLSVRNKCDFTCFETIYLGGSAVSQDLIDTLKELTQSKEVYAVYGMSELSGPAFLYDYPPPKGSNGNAMGFLDYRLVDIHTDEDIIEPNVPGELWVRGPTIFKGYYNNPEMTSEALTEDGWFKTGDIFYRDEYWHFYYVERLKSLLKYRNNQISPAEVEIVIRKHPEVQDVCIVGLPDKECGDLVVACVVPKTGTSPKAQEIKDLVKESLAESKQLRGGVIFLKELPVTSTSKINRKKIQEIALTATRE